MFICKQKMSFILPLYLEILQNKKLEASLHTPKMIASACRKFWYLSAGKRTTSSSMFFWKYSKDVQTSYFGYSDLAWIRAPKMAISTYRKFDVSLHTKKKHFKIFSGKLMTRFFKKSQNPYFRTILGIFLPHLQENETFLEKESSDLPWC